MQAEQRKLRVLYHEAATLLLTRVAVFLNRHINQLCEQRFGEMADLWMAWRYGGQGATIAANGVDAPFSSSSASPPSSFSISTAARRRTCMGPGGMFHCEAMRRPVVRIKASTSSVVISSRSTPKSS